MDEKKKAALEKKDKDFQVKAEEMKRIEGFEISDDELEQVAGGLSFNLEKGPQASMK